MRTIQATQLPADIARLSCIELCQLMLDKGKADAQRNGYRWDNRHPTFREIRAAYEANDLEEARRIYLAAYC
jgi:hypothetical protein